MAIQFSELPPEVFPETARPYIGRFNRQMRDLFGLESVLRNPILARRSDNTIVRRSEAQVDVSRITPSIVQVVSGQSTVVGLPNLTLGTANTVGSTTTAVSVNSAIALFGVGLPAGLSSAAATGSSAFASRSDHVHLFPTSLRSTANASTLALTDDAVNQTLAGSIGDLLLRPSSKELSLPMFTGSGDAQSNTAILRFVARTNAAASFPYDNTVRFGIDSSLTIDDVNTTYTSQTHTLFRGSLTTTANQLTGSTFTSETNRVIDLTLTGVVVGSGAGVHSWTERTGALIAMNTPGATGTGNVTVTDQYGLRITHALPVATGTVSYVNTRGIQVQMPRTGSTIKRGIELVTDTTGSGTAPVNSEGFYCQKVAIGNTRTSYWGEGATTGTPALVRIFFADAHAVGTSRYSFFGVSDTAYFGGVAEIGGALRHLGAQIGLHGNSSIAQSTGWSVSNITSTKTLNGSSFTLNDVMNTLGTVLTYLQNRGDIAA